MSMNSGQKGLDVIFMGNSYTQSNNLDGLVESALQQNSPSANADKLAAGGLRIDQHATRAQTAGHQWNTTLNNGNWDWVILQDQRSEEHTSELQSRTNLVCRLLLEKKKTKKIHNKSGLERICTKYAPHQYAQPVR